jgi:WD40 repeat protein
VIVFQYPRKRSFATVALSHDVSQIAAGGPSDPIVIWDVATGAEKHRIERVVAYPTQSLVFHPRAPWVYAAASYGLTAFNTATGELCELWGKEAFARNVAMDPTGRRLIGSRHKLWTNQRDLRWLACLDVTDPDRPVKEWERLDANPPDDGWTGLVAFFADGTRFVSAETSFGYNPRLTVRTAADGELVRTVLGLGTSAEQLTVAPGGETIVTRANRRLYVFDLLTADAPARELKNDNRKHFTGIAFHPSGKYLAVTSNDETVKLYDSTTWDVAHTFTWKIGQIRSVTFSADGTLAAAGSDTGKVVLWDVDL